MVPAISHCQHFLSLQGIDRIYGGDFKVKKYVMLTIGIAELIAGIIWMLLSQSSTGLFLLFAGLSGSAIWRGITIIKHKR